MTTATLPRETGARLSVRDLKSALTATAAVVSARAPSPALTCVRLVGGRAIATNGSTRIDVALDVDLDCLLPHSRLLAIVNSCPMDADIALTAKEETVVVKCKTGRWVLPSLDPAEFPEWAEGKTAAGLSLPSDQFLRAMQSVMPACDKMGTLASVLIETQEDGAAFVATDGRRMAVAKVDHDLAIDSSRLVIPSDAALALTRLVSLCGSEAEVQMRYTGSAIQITIGERVMLCRQMSGDYPKWQKVDADVPDEATAVDRHELASAVRAAAVVTSENSKAVTFSFAKAGITLAGKSAEYGTSTVSCGVFRIADCPAFSVNPAYVTGWLDSLPPDAAPYVEIGVVEKRVVMECDDYRAIVMPMEN
jgi:DNA polymerase III subunit beta